MTRGTVWLDESGEITRENFLVALELAKRRNGDGQCDHDFERHQHWDECRKCGARWSPEHGFNTPMARR